MIMMVTKPSIPWQSKALGTTELLDDSNFIIVVEL